MTTLDAAFVSRQGELLPGLTGPRGLSPADWERFLLRGLGQPIRVGYARSRREVVRLEAPRPDASPRRLKLHYCFAQAPPEVQAELLDWVRAPRRQRGPALDAWIDASLAALPVRERRARRVAQGSHFDLERLQAELVEQHFADDFSLERAGVPAITWTQPHASRSRHSLRLGCYERAQHLIRLHWVLDRPAVPEYFVRFVVFHELLHAAVGREPGRRCHHGARFRAREREFPEFERARDWERKNVRRLVAWAKGGPHRSEPRWGWLEWLQVRPRG